jgi:hypothetical protein
MTMPRVEILIALKEFLESKAALAVRPFKVRHHRHRESSEEEYPCCAIRFVSEDPQGASASDAYPSSAEEVVDLSVDLIFDGAIDVEIRTGDTGADGDPTGMGRVSAMSEVMLSALFNVGGQPETLGGLLWNIRYDGTADDEPFSSPDFARVTERLVLQYRVRAEAPTQILT